MGLGRMIVAASLSVLIGLLSTSCSTFKSLGLSFSDHKGSSALLGNSKISGQKPENYTIQLASGFDADHLQQSLTAVTVNCEIFHFHIKHGKKEQLHVMTCGSFSSLEEANSVMMSLPIEMNTSTSGVYQWKDLQQRATND
jgi:hypothetical protein